MFKWTFAVLLALISVVYAEPRLVSRMEIDPPTNPLHFVKLTKPEKQVDPATDNQAKVNPKFVAHPDSKTPLKPRLGRWDAHDPGYYTDSFARYSMFPLSAAAYADDPSPCLVNRFKNATLSKHVLTTCEHEVDGKQECAGFTALAHHEKAIIVSFRGTNGFVQLMTEVGHVVLKKKEASTIGGMVAYYFYTVFQQIWDGGLKVDVERLLKEYPEYEIWVTGHSLGGSVASIAATQMLNDYNLEEERIKLITFGQPRTGDTDYAVAHNLRLPRSYRVTHKRDLVPHVPPEKFESYFHHQSEIWYPSGMASTDLFIVCNDGESNECSDKQWLDISVDDHLHYFNRGVSDYGIGGCVELLDKATDGLNKKTGKEVQKVSHVKDTRTFKVPEVKNVQEIHGIKIKETDKIKEIAQVRDVKI